ncbi:histidinol-phosphate transaminase [Lysobacter koreensis]|uniref:Histidinol-phosphate aminotransferase n=1 Tax=Lysobacter koreensis TaxID=266122 RepID=A0ABW2YJF0_9GAMM
MNPSIDLVRADLRDFAGYRSARSEQLDGRVWLNANESPWSNLADPDESLRRYPEPQPPALRAALAGLYGCEPAQLLAGRGSDEGIDLLVRATCRPGADAIVVTPPTFGMYAVAARLHGTRVVEVPLIDRESGFECDFGTVATAALASAARLVFLCSPGNPSGTLLPLDRISRLSRELEGRALMVVDEAYIEYADAPSAVSLLATHANIVVLRTLSKAHALAAARIGSVIADPALIAVLQRCQAPYPLAAPCVERATRALAPACRAATQARIANVRNERELLIAGLRAAPGVMRAYPSRANFVLARFAAPQAAFERLLAQGIVVRDMRAAAGLGNALRITIGTPEQNAAVIGLLGETAMAALPPDTVQA